MLHVRFWIDQLIFSLNAQAEYRNKDPSITQYITSFNKARCRSSLTLPPSIMPLTHSRPQRSVKMAIKNEETRIKLMKLMSKLHAQQNETVLIRTKQLILKVNGQQCLLLLIVLTLTQDYQKNFFSRNKLHFFHK